MVVDVSLSNLDFSSTGVACHVQELVSISVQNIQIVSRLETELIQYGCPCFPLQPSGLSMNCKDLENPESSGQDDCTHIS